MKFQFINMTEVSFSFAHSRFRDGGFSSTLRLRLMERIHHVVAAISRSCGLFRYYGREIQLRAFFLPAIKYFGCVISVHNQLPEIHVQRYKK